MKRVTPIIYDKYTEESLRYVSLVRSVFSTPEGQLLLQELKATVGDLRSTDPHEQSYRVGKYELVREFEFYATKSQQEINEMFPPL